jgi:hypothetical protein
LFVEKEKTMRNRLRWLLGLTVVALTACGGGGGGTGTGTGTVAATAVNGTMTKTSATSITVNSKTFDVGAATVRIDDRLATAAELHNGMRVRVRGSDDGAGHGRATEVEAENEVRGAVTSVSASTSPQFFNIGDVKVIVDSATVYENLVPASFAAIQTGVFVEVAGARDASGNVLATRVEGKGARNPNAAEVDELHGIIGTVISGASQFTIGAITVTFTSTTTFTPPTRCTATSLAQGMRVEAHGAFTAADAFAATRIDCEDMEDESRDASRGDHDSLEGFVTGLDTILRTFTIDGKKVSYSTSTQFKNSTEADLANNVEVEVEGTFDGTTLVAQEIEFERTRVILTGTPSAVTVNSLTLFGEVVQVNDATEIRAVQTGGAGSTALADITAAVDRVEVRAFLDNGKLVAERITEIGNSGGGRDVVQARVVAKNEPALTLGLLDAGNPINVALTGAQLEGTDGMATTSSAFFAAIAVASASNPGTLVKARGHFAGATLTADEIEIEE